MSEFQSIVQNKLTEICASTTLSSELCNSLKEHNLITQSEFQKLNSFLSFLLHNDGATYLFTSIVPKLAVSSEDKFIEALRAGKNEKVVGILRPTSSEHGKAAEGVFPLSGLKAKEIEFLRGFYEGKFPQEGKFEGLQLRDEEIGNELLRGKDSEWTVSDAEAVVVKSGVGAELIQKVKSVVKCLENGTLWWNPNAVPLPPNFIPRRVRRLTNSSESGDSVALSELTNVSYPFLWLVDSAGSGKSTVTTKLEEEWRRSMTSPRVIVRINLNVVRKQLKKKRKKKNDFGLAAFLKRFVPFLPLKSLCRLPRGSVGVVVLLDGLDEVLPQHEATMLRLLRTLLLSPMKAKRRDFDSLVLRSPKLQDSLRLKKVFLTTRPHLRNLVESEFGVTAHSLLPLDLQQQILCLSKEVSTEFKFPEEKVRQTLSALSSSTSSLMENPLMLFLLAQVIKHNCNDEDAAFLDLFELYERIIRSKHTLHVAQKERIDPNKQRRKAEGRTKGLLEDNLRFYYAAALAQLARPHNYDSLRVAKTPSEKKREKLLSIGLLTANSADPSKLRFVHRSFAEFFYARLLTAPTTPLPLRNALFAGIYETLYTPGNIEEFVLCTLKKLRASDPSKPLLLLSKGWLVDPIVSKRALRNFLCGRLFPLLGEELLSSSVDLDNPKVINNFESVATDSEFDGIPLCRWLVSRRPTWVRTRLLKLPASSKITREFQWTESQANLVAHLRYADPKGLARSLNTQEIQNALASCHTLITDILCCRVTNCDHPRRRLRRWLGAGANDTVKQTKAAFVATLELKEAAWGMAEFVSRDQFKEIFFTHHSHCDPAKFKVAWGGEFVEDLIETTFASHSDPHSLFQGGFCDLGVDKLLGMLGEGEASVEALRRIFRGLKNTRLLEELEARVERRGCGEPEGHFNNNFARRVIQSRQTFVWDELNALPFSFLPFVIRYGQLPQVIKHFHHIPPQKYSTLQQSNLEAAACALVVSLLVDDTHNTYAYVKSLIQDYYKQRRSEGNELLHVLLRVGVDDLMAASSASVPSGGKGQCPLVREVPWGQVLLRTLPTIPNLPLGEFSMKLAVNDLLQNPECCGVAELLLLLLRQTPPLKKLLLQQVSREVTLGRRGGHFLPHNSDRCRLRGFIQFVLHVDGLAFTRMRTESTWVFLMHVVVEGCLPSPHGDPSGGWKQVSDLLPSIHKTIKTEFENENQSPRRLLELFATYVTEWEWSVVLQTLQIVPTQTEFQEIPETQQIFVYKDPATPLLRVWRRHFGEEETRKVAEDIDFSEYPGLPGEAALLAVELGSPKMLNEVAWPSILGWRDANGRSLLDFAVKKWGQRHEVSAFLRQRFLVKFNS